MNKITEIPGGTRGNTNCNEGKYGKGDFIPRLAGVWGYHFKLGGKLCFGVDTESRLGTV